MKRTHLLSTILLFGIISLANAQDRLSYEGPYLQGEATYEYVENEALERILDGKFSYTETRNIPARGGDQEILVTGNFRENKKHLAWAVTVKPVEDGGVTETIIGNFSNGEKSGLWTHRIIRNEDNSVLKEVQASFIKNHFRGPFSFTYENPESENFTTLKIKGGFDQKGMLDGEWTIESVMADGSGKLETSVFKHGVLSSTRTTNIPDGGVVEEKDNSAFVEAFFANMAPLDSSSTVADKKYGIRMTSSTHKILNPIINGWMNMNRFVLDNSYDASIPTMIVRQGVAKNPNILQNRAEIIDWRDTPQGKAEYEAQLAKDKAYNEKINLADLQFDQGNHRQALPLYKEALGIKKEEQYPKDQIAKIEEMIRVEDEKNKVITVVNSKRELFVKNNRMLEAESYYGKKKHLYEAASRALRHQSSNMRSKHQQTEAFLNRKAYKELSLETLKEFEADLDDAMRFQERVRQLAKQEDTKDLEKELKKLEDPTAIKQRIMQ